jgi:hypothetical protein
MGAIADTAEQQKRAVLAAGAEAGKAGVQAYDAARAALDAQQASAVQRGHSIAQTVGVTAEQQGALDAFVQAPISRGQAALANSRALFEANRASADATNAAYFDKIAALEPLVQARAAAAKSGGGGGGGEDTATGGLSDLTDAQTGKFLMNAAVERRNQQMADTAQAQDLLTAAANATQQQRRQTRRQLRKGGRLGKLALRDPQKLQNRQARQQRRLEKVSSQLLEGKKGAFDTEGERTFRGVTYPNASAYVEARKKHVARLDKLAEQSRRITELRGQSKTLREQISAADEQYRSLIPTEGGIPLSDTARQIASELGVDPALAASLVGPTVDAQYMNALSSSSQRAQPNLYADATFLRIRPSDLRSLEKSQLWQVMDQAANNAVADGVTREQFEATMRQFANNPQSLLGKDQPKTREALKDTTTEERRLAYLLAVRRYSTLLPTITEKQRVSSYAADQAALQTGG